MFKFTYILLIFAFFNAEAEEPNLIWQKEIPGVQSSLKYNDSIMFMHSNRIRNVPGNVTWLVDFNTGDIVDSIFHDMSVVIYSKLSPNKKILAIGNYGRVVLIDLQTKQVLKQFDSQRDFVFKNDSILYVMKEGIYEINIITNETKQIWKNEAETGWPPTHISLGYKSMFSYDAKYAVVITNFPSLFDINKGEIVQGYSSNSIPVFNPYNYNEFIFYGGERIDIYSFDDLINPKSKIYLDPHVLGEPLMKIVNNGNHYALRDYRSIRFYNSINYSKDYEIDPVGIDFILVNNKIYINKGNIHYLYDISSILSTEETQPKNTIIKPNPNDGTFDLVLEIQIPENYEFSIINNIGEIVYIDNKFLNNGINNINFNLSLPNGYYIISIKNNNNILTEKFIINK